MYNKRLDAYRAELKRPLSVYLCEERLMLLLFSTIHGGRDKVRINALVTEICSFSPELALMDRVEGFNVIGDIHAINEPGFSLFSLTVVDLLKKLPDCGDLYAKAALFLVRFLSHER